MGRILNFNNTPWILTTPDLLAMNLDHGIRTHNCKWDGLAKLLHLLLVVLILVTENERMKS
jgi:hypothetical protein